jgi:hypothetical protein
VRRDEFEGRPRGEVKFDVHGAARRAGDGTLSLFHRGYNEQAPNRHRTFERIQKIYRSQNGIGAHGAGPHWYD